MSHRISVISCASWRLTWPAFWLASLLCACGPTASTPDARPAPVPDAAAMIDAVAMPDAAAMIDAAIEIDARPDLGPCDGKPDGAPCGDPLSSECTAPDTCLAGVCVAHHTPADTACGDPQSTSCSAPDRCDGAGNCLANHAPAGTACGDQGNTECTSPDRCDGAGNCLANDEPAGTACGDATETTCNHADTCTSGACATNLTADGTRCDDCAAGPGLCDACYSGVCVDQCRDIPVPTELTFNNGADGTMFDIRASRAVRIRSFDTVLDAATHTIEIYYRAGSFQGHQNNAGSWTLAGTATGVVSTGTTSATPLSLQLDVVIPAGQIYGFYITTRAVVPNMRFLNGTSIGAEYVSDGTVTLHEGISLQYPFGSSVNQARLFRGAVHYETCVRP